MPKGDNPNSRANLRPVKTKAEARERGAIGGRKSGEVRRTLKTFKEIDAENTTTEDRQAMLNALMKKAKCGNIKAMEVYRDTVGLKPVEKVQVVEVEAATIDEIERLFND